MSRLPNTLPFFALTTAGLEAISARELAWLPQITVQTTSYRRLAGTCQGDLASLASLRTVDDVFLELATWREIGRPRSSLKQLRQCAARLDLHPAKAHLARLRAIDRFPQFSLSVSFVGQRNYTSEEIKESMAKVLEHTHRGWRYQQDDRQADLNVRVFLEQDVATVGVRVSKTPLHDRPYQRVHLPGTLKPSVAAALVVLAQITSTTTVLDPCCGSGTILIEAALQKASACGGDSNPTAVAAAQANAGAAGVTVPTFHWDATSLPQASASIDRVITNLPWGRQVAVETALPVLYQRLFTQMRRVLAPAGRIVVLTDDPELLDPLDLSCVERFEISLFGQRPTILVFSSTSAQPVSGGPHPSLRKR
jgi:tRNA (guanine6-N2)-methyltransferase